MRSASLTVSPISPPSAARWTDGSAPAEALVITGDAGDLTDALSIRAPLDADVPGVEQGNRMLVKPDGVAERSLGDGALDRAARAAALELLEAERSEVRILSGSSGQARAFVEVLEPPLRLLICGAGHDAGPLVEAAADLG